MIVTSTGNRQRLFGQRSHDLYNPSNGIAKKIPFITRIKTPADQANSSIYEKANVLAN